MFSCSLAHSLFLSPNHTHARTHAHTHTHTVCWRQTLRMHGEGRWCTIPSAAPPLFSSPPPISVPAPSVVTSIFGSALLSRPSCSPLFSQPSSLSLSLSLCIVDVGVRKVSGKALSVMQLLQGGAEWEGQLSGKALSANGLSEDRHPADGGVPCGN